MPAGFWIRYHPWKSLVQDLEGGRVSEAMIAPAGRFMSISRWGMWNPASSFPASSCESPTKRLQAAELTCAGGLEACTSWSANQQRVSMTCIVPTLTCFCKSLTHFIKFIYSWTAQTGFCFPDLTSDCYAHIFSGRKLFDMCFTICFLPQYFKKVFVRKRLGILMLIIALKYFIWVIKMGKPNQLSSSLYFVITFVTFLSLIVSGIKSIEISW